MVSLALHLGRKARLAQGDQLMNYITLLETTAKSSGNCACMGIDPNFSALPEGIGVEEVAGTRKA